MFCVGESGWDCGERSDGERCRGGGIGTRSDWFETEGVEAEKTEVPGICEEPDCRSQAREDFDQQTTSIMPIESSQSNRAGWICDWKTSRVSVWKILA